MANFTAKAKRYERRKDVPCHLGKCHPISLVYRNSELFRKYTKALLVFMLFGIPKAHFKSISLRFKESVGPNLATSNCR